jgi:hypothetical protein
MTVSKGLRQAYQMQDLTFDAAMSLKRSMTNEGGELTVDKEGANAIATLIRAWQSAQEQVRIHRNKPLPGSLRPASKVKDADAGLGG